MAYEMTLLDLAREIAEGSYLYEYDEDTDETRSMPRDMDDDHLDQIRSALRERGLQTETDDIGWLVVARNRD